MSWDPVVATKYHENLHPDVTWSQCSKFIAVAKGNTIEILDAVTLNRLNTFELPPPPFHSVRRSFSPDSHFLTVIYDGKLVSWDLQTGGPVCTILSAVDLGYTILSATYSTDGRMFAAAYKGSNGTSINTYDLLSRTYKGSYRVSDRRVIDPIWAHGDRLRFATTKGRRITIWEVAFTLTHPPAEVTSFPTPDGTDDATEFLFHPTPPRLAFTLEHKILVWDAKTSKFLLESGLMPVSDAIAPSYSSHFKQSSFSSDGRFFASMTGFPDAETYVWRESPNGYILHQRLVLANVSSYFRRPFLSPNGESIVVFFNGAIHLWHTTDQTLPPSSIPTEKKEDHSHFILRFSPNETSAAFARMGGNMVTVLDLQSGGPRAVIDTGMRVGCLGVGESTVAVTGRDGKMVTWSLPAWNDTLNSRVNITDNVQTTMLVIPEQPGSISVSADLSLVAITGGPPSQGSTLGIYDALTGRRLAEAKITQAFSLLVFTPDGHEVWGHSVIGNTAWAEGWEIPQDSKPGCTELKSLGRIWNPQGGFPWQSRRGYEVTGDGWALSPTQKRLLWLPHYWRLGRLGMTWGGRYLGLGYHQLQEVVILEFPE